MKKFLCVLAAVLISGCASLSPHERGTYTEIMDLGAPCEKVASPATAAALNILPGIGDIYLATGNGANGASWGAFALDLLLWPYSVVWAIPQGAVTAKEVNKRECVNYYVHTREGQRQLARLKTEQVALDIE